MSGWEASYQKLLFSQDESSVNNDFETLTSFARNMMKEAGRHPLYHSSKSWIAFEWDELIKLTEIYHLQIQDISEYAYMYDSSTKVQGNGYRTFMRLGALVAKSLTKVLVEMRSQRSQTPKQVKELRAWMEAIKDLINLTGFVQQLKHQSPIGSLFPFDPEIENVEMLARKIANLDMSRFYGFFTAFYLDGDSQFLVKSVSLSIALYSNIYSLSYFGMGMKLAKNVVRLSLVLFDTEKMVNAMSNIVKEMPVEFCKSFFNMPESMVLGRFMKHNAFRVATSHHFSIPSSPLRTKNLQGNWVQIPIPQSHVGARPLFVRFISPFRTDGMVGTCLCSARCICYCPKRQLSNRIFFHMHGGGFVSQTSKSHETYLFQWAVECDIPILSIDYSLAPEAPYPRALEEVLFAYAWMRENFSKLGTTGEIVIVGGDSAGGNLSVGLFQLCLQLNLAPPSSLFMFYPLTLCEMYPSPSRLISLMDPMVMFPLLMRCLNAYNDQSYKSSCPRTFSEEIEECKSYRDPLLSPLRIDSKICSKFPPTHLFTTDVDPCLDETIYFSNKLIDNGAPVVTLDILEGLPHGFLSINGISSKCRNAVNLLTLRMKSLMP